jgi:hypothetical protein
MNIRGQKSFRRSKVKEVKMKKELLKRLEVIADAVNSKVEVNPTFHYSYFELPVKEGLLVFRFQDEDVPKLSYELQDYDTTEELSAAAQAKPDATVEDQIAFVKYITGINNDGYEMVESMARQKFLNRLREVIIDFQQANGDRKKWDNAVQSIVELISHSHEECCEASKNLGIIWRSSRCANEDMVIMSLQLLYKTLD